MKISIDLWGTLIQSNPFFKKARLNLVKEVFGNIEDQKIDRAFSKTKQAFNNIIEISGLHFPRHQIFAAFHQNLYEKSTQYKKLIHFMNEYDKIALEYSPELYSDETLEQLQLLQSLTPNLILSSNTMMLNSNVLLQVLENLYVIEYFKETNFSDILGCSKPHVDMFSNSNYHIGDNHMTDFLGAENAGSTPILINSNGKTLKDAYNFIISTEGI